LIHILESRLRRLRRWFSRNEWSLKFLGLSKTSAAAERGLVLIQIDGLSRAQLEKALKRGRMPFLRKLQKREGYHLHTLYSGIPSTTAAAQAELFYGVKGAVPAFAYRERESGRYMKLILPECASRVEENLEGQHQGLLSGGSAYSNMYSGGASEAHFCASGLGAGSLLKNANPLGFMVVLLWNFPSILRLIGLLGLEFIVAFYDSIRGAIARGEVRQELLFVFSRVLVCVGLRELITVEACMDVTRCLPIVHVNFVGYDEQAHRRGPSSKFAHFSLRGIDNCIQRIWSAAHLSHRRDYDVWIYSDHGQESVVPYARENHRALDAAVAEVLGTPIAAPTVMQRIPREGSQDPTGKKAESYLLRHSGIAKVEVRVEDQASVVIAIGPFGHIYLPEPIVAGLRDGLARKLVDRANIPMVLFADGPDRARVITAEGHFELPKDALKVLGAVHPFPVVCAEDLVKACHHPNSGDFIICGWRTRAKPISFVWENGAHGGPGYEETRAFGLFPISAAIPHDDRILRYSDIREAAQHLRGQPSSTRAYPRKPGAMPGNADKKLRIMTYNIHGCAGMDGKVCTSRIARVIAQYEPDLVALQESYGEPPGAQALAILKELKEIYHFPSDMRCEQDDYGNAILSVFPMQLIKSAKLPTLPGRDLEIRGAIWVKVNLKHNVMTSEPIGGESSFNFLNTHLGLFSMERQKQTEALLGDAWLGGAETDHPALLVGDFNASPSSTVFRSLTSRFFCAQENATGHKFRNTFPGRYPVTRIDHIFCSREFKIHKVEVPRSHLTRLASDHLPLVAEVHFPTESLVGSLDQVY
jgi:endonuclease/exonuclease/phosphatase family metal-dependent hydrolase